MKMKIDLFTKTVLSVIAACLILLALKNYEVIKTANAGRRQIIDVNIERVNGHSFSNGVPVRILGK